MNAYNRMMALEDDATAYESGHAQWTDYESECDQWFEYNDCCLSGFYNRQHALAVRGNAENGIIYYQTDDVRVLALGYVEE